MIRISFITLADGREYKINAAPGQSLMEAAVAHKIPGIIGECGGVCACATCHIYLDKADMGRVAAMGPVEEDILSLLDNVRPTSRLACQIPIMEQLDGLKVYIP